MESRCRSAVDLRRRRPSLGAVTSSPPVYIIGSSSLYVTQQQQLLQPGERLKSSSASRLRMHAPPETRRTLPISRSFDHRDAVHGKYMK